MSANTTATMQASTPGASLLALFDRLCDLPELQREQQLLALQATDPDLVAQLRELLRADARTSEQFAQDIEQQLPLAEAVTHAAYVPNDFAAFTLIRSLGAGGMGVVWLAERRLTADAGALTQQVAIKFMRDRSPSLLRAFARERDALARLEHPGIARLIDAGVSPDGVPYIATEYVNGTTLTDYVRTHALDLPARLLLIESLCDAVDYAHQRLLVHRDIKPSNILVDQSGRVRLLDFGIAKALDPAFAQQTQNNPLTPAYAAPEQIFGEPISTATDVFALGLLLFELLTGQPPSQRRSLSSGDLVHKISSEAIEAPSRSVPNDAAETSDLLSSRADWRKRISGDLDLIVLKALRREPERRYTSARALAQDLQRFREGKTITARPDSAGYRVHKFILRHRLAVASAAIAVLALIVGLGSALWQASVARANASDARAQLQRAEAIKQFTQSLFQEQDPLARSSATARTPHEMIAAGIERARTQFRPDDPVRAELLGDLAAIQVALGEFAPALSTFDEVSQARDIATVAAARRESVRAVALGGLGRFEEALTTAGAAAALLRRELGAEHPETLRAEQRLLRLKVPTSEALPALLQESRSLVQRTERVFGASASESLIALVDLSSVQERMDNYTELLETMGELVQRIETALGPEHLMLARPLARIGDVNRVLQHYDIALKYFDRALAIARKHQVKTSLSGILMRRGDTLRRMERFELAAASFDEAITLMPPDSAEAAQLEQMRGVLARVRGDYNAAARHMLASQQGFERALGKPSTYSWTSAIARVGVELERGQAKQVEQLARDAYVAMRQLSPPPSFDVFLATGTLAQVEAQLGQHAAAIARFDDAIALGTAVYSADHDSVLEAQVLRTTVLPRSQDREARAELERLLARPALNEALRRKAQDELTRRSAR